MDQQSIGKFSDEHVRAINETDDHIRKWKKFQHDYEALRGRLATLPDKVTYEIMVPFTSLAFMPGRLVHTNELLVLLGDNWFAERSAKEAAEIVERRLNVVRKTLSDLEKEKVLLTSRHEFTKGLKARAESGKEFEIKEEYDEQKERLWREEHRRRVTAAKKAGALADKPQAGHDVEVAHRKVDQSAASSASCVDYASALARLNELGLQERKRRELLCRVDESGAGSVSAAAATAGAPADTVDSDDDDDTDTTTADASTHSSRLHCHTNSESVNDEVTGKKRVTFFDEIQRRKSSDLSQTGTGNSSDGSDDSASEAETDETEEEEEEVEDEGNVDEAPGKQQSFGEDDGDASFAVDYCQWMPPGSNPHATIYFTHSRAAEEVLPMEEADDKELTSSSHAVPIPVLSPADVYKLVEGSDPVRPIALQPPLLSAAVAVSEGKSHELKSILKKQQVGDTDDDGDSISRKQHATVQPTGMLVKPVPPLPASAVTTAFGDHVIEREPSTLPSTASPVWTSETVQSSGPQRPMSKFKAQQQRLHR